MSTLDTFLSDSEIKAEQEYRQVYYTEYMRVYEPARADDREKLLFWSDLAHRAAKSARDRMLKLAEEQLAA